MNHELPADLRDVAAAVDRLAAADRAEAQGLEDRVMAASASSLNAGGLRLVHAASGREVPAPPRLVRAAWSTPKRLAAALALAGAALALVVAVRWAPRPAPEQFELVNAEREVEIWLAATVPFDTALASEIGLLSEETARLREGLAGWAWNDSFDEGSL